MDFIDYTSMWNENELQAQYLKEMGLLFEEETGINIKFTFYGRDVLTKIRSRILMGDFPDLVDQDLSELSGSFIENSIVSVESLTTLFMNQPGPEGQNRFIDVFPEEAMKLYAVNSEYYFFPYIFITSGFFYNKTLFSEMDIDVPVNWEEFRSINQILKKADIAPIALDGTIAFYNAYYYYWFLTRMTGAGLFLTAAEDRSGQTWDNPSFLTAAEHVYSLGRRGDNFFQNDYSRSIFPIAQSKWSKQKSASILCGSWIPSETINDRDFETGFFPFPAIKNGSGSLTDVEAYLIGCVIPEGASHSEEAREFLKFLIKKENSQKLVDTTLNISVRRDLIYPESLSEVMTHIDNGKKFHAPYSGVWFLYPEWFQKIFLPLHDKLIFGEINPPVFVEQMKKKTVEYWKKNQ